MVDRLLFLNTHWIPQPNNNVGRSLIGKKAEDIAYSFLKKNGLELITRNYRCRFGEIDLIMQDSEILVFVEVRYRKSDKYGSAIESVDFNKQRKLVFTVKHCLSKTSNEQPTRLDIVALSSNEPPQWIIDAFMAHDG